MNQETNLDDIAFAQICKDFEEAGNALKYQRQVYEDMASHVVQKFADNTKQALSALDGNRGEAFILLSLIGAEVFSGIMSFITYGAECSDETIDSFAEVCKEHAKETRARRHAKVDATLAAKKAAAES